MSKETCDDCGSDACMEPSHYSRRMEGRIDDLVAENADLRAQVEIVSERLASRVSESIDLRAQLAERTGVESGVRWDSDDSVWKENHGGGHGPMGQHIDEHIVEEYIDKLLAQLAERDGDTERLRARRDGA